MSVGIESGLTEGQSGYRRDTCCYALKISNFKKKMLLTQTVFTCLNHVYNAC